MIGHRFHNNFLKANWLCFWIPCVLKVMAHESALSFLVVTRTVCGVNMWGWKRQLRHGPSTHLPKIQRSYPSLPSLPRKASNIYLWLVLLLKTGYGVRTPPQDSTPFLGSLPYSLFFKETFLQGGKIFPSLFKYEFIAWLSECNGACDHFLIGRHIVQIIRSGGWVGDLVA